MILDSLKNARNYEGLHPGFRAGFDFLSRADLRLLPHGIHEIKGKDIYATVSRSRGVGREKAVLEAHRTYADIQYVVEGADVFGWHPVSECELIRQAYDPARDCEFFSDLPQVWADLKAGSFAVFFPWDAHAPLAVGGQIHKVVIKVRMDWTGAAIKGT